METAGPCLMIRWDFQECLAKEVGSCLTQDSEKLKDVVCWVLRELWGWLVPLKICEDGSKLPQGLELHANLQSISVPNIPVPPSKGKRGPAFKTVELSTVSPKSDLSECPKHPC